MLGALVTALAHFVWQGLLLAAAVAVLMHIARPGRPQVRYVVYCSALVLLALCPLVTFCLELGNGAPLTAIVDSTGLQTVGGEPRPAMADGHRATLTHEAKSLMGVWRASTAAWLAQHRVAIAAIWFAGVALFAARLSIAAVWLRRVRRNYLPLPPALLPRAALLAERMGFGAPPEVRVVAGLTQALAAGVLRPLVLLPAAWLAELDPATLEAVLAHELAHLSRWDLAVNAAQRVIESLLFFHPAVWWCSAQIRREREMCCDELAVAALNDRADYARALANLAERVALGAAPAWSVGSGGSRGLLLARVRQLLGVTSAARGPWYGPTCALSGAMVASLVWGLMVLRPEVASSHATAPSPVEDTPATEIQIPPQSSERQTFSFFVGSAEGSGANEGAAPAQPPTAPPVVRPPHEHRMVSLPPYTIEPPDILKIELLAMSPGENYRVHPGDTFAAQANAPGENGEPVHWVVDKQGFLDFDEPKLTNVKVGGLTVAEAVTLIKSRIFATVPKDKLPEDIDLQIWLERAAGLAPIKGEFLVSPDGRVNLGAAFGLVHLAGMTIEGAKAAIEEQLAKTLDKPEVSVNVFAYNSKVYYVISQNSEKGDQVARCPVTGNETVLDALSQTNGLEHLEKKKIWIARPSPGKGQADSILPVSFQEIARGSAAGTNYQILPGDRIFVAEPISLAPQSKPDDGASNRPSRNKSAER